MTRYLDDVASTERPVRRPLWARVSTGQAVMVLAASAAFVLNVNLIRSQEATVMVAIAGEDLAPGVTLEEGALRFVPIDAENPVIGRLVAEESLPSNLGRVLTARVREGEFITLSVLADQATPTNLRAMAVPVDPAHAGGGSLIEPGDLVDIISVVEGSARYVVTGAEVLRVPDAGSGGLVAVSDFYVVIAVDADTALSVAEALQGDSLEVVLATGAPAPDRLSLTDGVITGVGREADSSETGG